MKTKSLDLVPIMEKRDLWAFMNGPDGNPEMVQLVWLLNDAFGKGIQLENYWQEVPETDKATDWQSVGNNG